MGQRLCTIDRDGSCTAGRINKIFLPSDTWSVMSHFKFVSTINAAEEGCTHSLVLGNRRLRLDTQGLRRVSTSNHHPFSSRRASRRLHSLGCSSVGGSEPQIQRFPTSMGGGQAGGKMGSRTAPGRPEGPSGAKHPLPQGAPQAQATLV